MKTLLKNARILTMKDENIFHGHIVIEDNLILSIDKNLPIGEFDSIIDCENNLLMPGFKNAHTHSAMTFLRSKADDSSLHDWLFNEIFPREANLKNGCVRELCKVAFLEYLSSGVTSCLDQYFFPQEFKISAEEMGYRTVSLGMYSANERPLEEVRRLYKEFNSSELSKMVIGMHSEYTADEDMYLKTKTLLDETGSKFYTHLSETKSEVEECILRHGKTPLAYFTDRGFFDNGGAIFHGVYLSNSDIEILKAKDITVVSNPGSNMKLASGIADIQGLLDKGIRIALGTDGPASNNALDMFREMYLVTGLQKLVNKNPVSIPAFEVLKMATVNGAIAMGLDNAKYLEKGQLADIIMIDLTRPSMQPINNIINSLVYAGSKDCVKMTMVNGKILYLNGKFLINEDISEIYKKVQALSDELNIVKNN